MPAQPRPAASTPSRTLQRWLIALLVIAVWAMLPPYVGPLVGLTLDVPAATEVVDHIIAGVVALAGGVLALSFARRGETDSVRLLAALGACALAGLFQLVAHVPLVLDAGGPLQPVGTVILHASPAPVLLAVSLYLMLRPLPEERRV